MITETLMQQLSRLRLKGFLETLEMRFEQASQQNLPHYDFLELILQDEVQRRDTDCIAKRLRKARFESQQSFEEMRLEHYPPKTQKVIRNLQNNQYLEHHQHVIIMGPTGTGKTLLAQALGNLACRKGYSTRFIRANAFLREMHASRADNTWEKQLKKFMSPQILILDDFGLKSLTGQEADDIYELIAERANRGSFIITSNRTVDAWVKLFPDPVMANAALDRLANKAHQIILEGESYRKKSRPTQEKFDD